MAKQNRKNNIIEAFNLHLNREIFSSHFYLSMAAYFEANNLKGFAHWMKIQVEEERFHVMKFFNFINERGGHVVLGKIDAPEFKWSSPLDVFEESLKHEEGVSERINDLVDLALKNSDHAANNFLQWFIAEQVEEEALVTSIVQQLKLIKNDPTALFMLDRELAKRVLNLPADAQN